MLTHGLSHLSVYSSVWEVVDFVNRSSKLKYDLQNHCEQCEISQGFLRMSGALFDYVIGCLDGMLIWTTKFPRNERQIEKCGDKNFKGSCKGKFSMNLQAIGDRRLRFKWLDFSWPDETSDYMASVTSDL